MQNKKFESKFGHNIELTELEKIKIAIFKYDEDFKTFAYEIEKPIKDLLTAKGEPKLIFKHKFHKGTKHLTAKMNIVKNAAINGEILELPYKVRTYNGQKYLNLLFLNEIHENN